MHKEKYSHDFICNKNKDIQFLRAKIKYFIDKYPIFLFFYLICYIVN